MLSPEKNEKIASVIRFQRYCYRWLDLYITDLRKSFLSERPERGHNEGQRSRAVSPPTRLILRGGGGGGGSLAIAIASPTSVPTTANDVTFFSETTSEVRLTDRWLGSSDLKSLAQPRSQPPHMTSLGDFNLAIFPPSDKLPQVRLRDRWLSSSDY